MAVADDAVKPAPPPPPRIVVALLALLRFVLAPMLALARVFLVAGPALFYLGLAIAWVLSAPAAATVVAGRACRDGSATIVFFEALTDAALKASICIIVLLLALAAVLLCGLCLAYVIAVVSGSGSEFKKSAYGAIMRESLTQEFLKFPRAVFLGFVTYLAFILLNVAGILVIIMLPPVEGSISQGEMIGSVIADVGIFGFHAISCFVIIPALAKHFLRESRKAGLTVVVVC